MSGPTERPAAEHARAAPPYLSIEQLAEFTPWSPSAIRKKIAVGWFEAGVDYFQPDGRGGRIIFCWAAVERRIRRQRADRAAAAGDELDEKLRGEARALFS